VWTCCRIGPRARDRRFHGYLVDVERKLNVRGGRGLVVATCDAGRHARRPSAHPSQASGGGGSPGGYHRGTVRRRAFQAVCE
jgi:hypothetical protein